MRQGILEDKMTGIVSEKYKSIEKYALEFLSSAGIVPENEKEYIIFPGFCDVHVHFREPGFSYKETILSGSAAAAHGGYTAVCPMPNLRPAPDCLENLNVELKAIESSPLRVIPYGTITKNEEGARLSEMREMSDYVCAFSDDGRGVQTADIMEKAMLEAKSLGKIIAAHCEVNSLLNGGYIHDGRYAAAHGHRGISSESEYLQTLRDIALCEKTCCAYHVCHISTKENVEQIRAAKARGVNITCETGPHYLTLCEDDLQEDGRFKMNPPLRSAEDREALIGGIKDGTIDMIATDHAPHSAEEKSRGLRDSLMGITGLETAFPVLYTKLVKPGIISLEKLTELLVDNPKKRFSIDTENDFTVFEVSEPYTIDSSEFLSMGKATPFEGMTVYGRCVLTVCKGKTVYEDMK